MQLTFGFGHRTLLRFIVAGLKFVAVDMALFFLFFFGVQNVVRDEIFKFLVPEFRLPIFSIPLPKFLELLLPILGMF